MNEKIQISPQESCLTCQATSTPALCPTCLGVASAKRGAGALALLLRPFAEHALALERCPQGRLLPDSCPLLGPSQPAGSSPTIGDARAAAAALYGRTWRQQAGRASRAEAQQKAANPGQ